MVDLLVVWVLLVMGVGALAAFIASERYNDEGSRLAAFIAGTLCAGIVFGMVLMIRAAW